MTAYATYPDLAGRTVIVTGGGSGIGAAIVRAFARQRAKIGFIDIADEPSRKLERELRGDGAAVAYVRADITDIEALRGAIAEIRAAHGPIGVLINNAAHDDRHKTPEVTPEYFDDRIAVNLKHVFFAMQAVLDDMIALGGGSIVNFSSVSWLKATGGMAIYTASKSAMLGLTRSIARDYGVHNIRANSIAPGWIMTERQKALWVTPEAERRTMEGQCLKRWLMPDEIANLALFLASNASSACTAQHFVADGGAT